MKTYLKNHWELVALILLITGLIAANIVWVALDQSPALWDIAGHSQRALYFGQLLSVGELQTIITFDTIYPPLPYLVSGVLFTIFGSFADIPQLSLLLWLCMFLISVYVIACELFQNKRIAILAVFVSAMYPLLAHFSRIFDLDFPLVAITTASIATLLLTKHFTSLPWTVAFGALVAGALLTKWTTVLFLVGPTLFILIDAIRLRKISKQVLIHIVIAILVALVVAGPWYLLHGSTILASAEATRNNVFSVPFENLWSADNWLFYIRQTIRTMTWPLAIFVIFGVFAMIQRREKSDALLLVAILTPYIFLSLIFSKESRYFLPVFPWLGLITAGMFWKMRSRLRTTVGVSLLVIVSLLVWTETSWHVRLLEDSTYDELGFEAAYGYQTIRPQDPKFGFTHPTQYHTNLDEIVAALGEDIDARKPNQKTINIGIVPNSIFLTAQQIQYEMRLAGIDTPESDYVFDYSVSSRMRLSNWTDAFSDADYFITKTGDQGPRIWGKSLFEIATVEANQEGGPFAKFELLETWPLNGIEGSPTEARLYRKR